MKLLSVLYWGALSCVIAVPLAAESPKIDGTWTVQGNTEGDGATAWVFHEDGDSLKVTRMKGTETLTAFVCNTMGRECELKDSGKKGTVSLWYNGPKLVEMEVRGNEIVKRRFALSDQDGLDVEVIRISPSSKTETIHLKRTQTSAKNQ